MAMKRLPDPNTVAVVGMAVVLLLVAWQQMNPPSQAGTFFQQSHETCRGLPIAVNYSYKGTPETPHECIVQCQDQREHYILYTNGMGTQCDDLPGCNDRGEDDGVTCDPPEVSPAS